MAPMEDQLRSAYDDIPPAHTDSAALLRGLETVDTRRRPRRHTATIAGAAAGLVAASAVGIATIAGHGSDTSIGHAAESGWATATSSQTKSGSSNSSEFQPLTAPPPVTDYTRERVPGDLPNVELSGSMLPHGTQLPKTWGYLVKGGNLESQRPSPELANKQAIHFGLVTTRYEWGEPPRYKAMYGVRGTATNEFGDADPRQEVGMFAILRFKSPAAALQTYASSLTAGNGYDYPDNRRAVAWPGVDPKTHFLHKYTNGLPSPSYEAIVQVGNYLVSAVTETPADSIQMTNAMIANLRGAGLVD